MWLTFVFIFFLSVLEHGLDTFPFYVEETLEFGHKKMKKLKMHIQDSVLFSF